MHFHLPKPLHGWRQFAGEVEIIVLGVLIALGAEQFVETAHQHQQGLQAEAIIRNEIELNLGRLQSRMGIHGCVDRRIEQVQALLDGAASDSNIVTPGWIGRPQYWTFLNSRWQAESQAGRAALVDGRRLSDYGIMYNRMENLLGEMDLEQADWAKLRTLEHLRRTRFRRRTPIQPHSTGRALSELAPWIGDGPAVRHGRQAGAARLAQHHGGRPVRLPPDHDDSRRGQSAERLAGRGALIKVSHWRGRHGRLALGPQPPSKGAITIASPMMLAVHAIVRTTGTPAQYSGR